MAQEVFKRYEKKYRMNLYQYQELRDWLSGQMQEDEYGKHTIYNLYYDTDTYELIRASLERPVYKEKLRLRSYGIPGADTQVFVELKKKFKGVVYKRRVPLTLREAVYYLERDIHPAQNSQILSEVDWFRRVHQNPSAKVMIAYDRVALFGKEDPALRVTFDTGIRWRNTLLDLSKGDWGTPLLQPDQVLMEIKIPGAMPLWMSHMLDWMAIRPTSFSKYGTCYQKHLWKECEKTGGVFCA